MKTRGSQQHRGQQGASRIPSELLLMPLVLISPGISFD